MALVGQAARDREAMPLAPSRRCISEPASQKDAGFFLQSACALSGRSTERDLALLLYRKVHRHLSASLSLVLGFLVVSEGLVPEMEMRQESVVDPIGHAVDILGFK